MGLRAGYSPFWHETWASFLEGKGFNTFLLAALWKWNLECFRCHCFAIFSLLSPFWLRQCSICFYVKTQMLFSSVLVSGEEHRRLWHFGSLLLPWGWDWAAQHSLPQPWPTDSTSDSVAHWPQWDPLHQHSGQSLQGLHSFTQHRVQVRDWISNLAQAWWGISIENRITGNRQLCSRLFWWMPSVLCSVNNLS